MLTPTFLRHAGSNFFNGGSVSSIPCALMHDVLPYQLCLVTLESAALGAINGETSEHTLSDDAGTVYTKIGEQTRQPEPFRPGCTLSLWMVRPLATIPLGTLLTGGFSAAVDGGEIAISLWDCHSSLNTLTVLGYAGDNGSTGGASDPAVTLTPPDWDDFLWFGVGCFDASPTTVIVPLTPGWKWDRHQMGNGGNNFTGQSMFSQYRIVEALTQTWTVAAASDRRWCMLLVAFQLQAPIAPTVAGGRQFEADFETGTQGYAGTSSSLRPDAVSLDYLQATAIGPSAVDAGGIFSYTWKARATATEVLIARQNAGNTDWDPETVLFSYSGAPITELYNGFTFDRDSRPAVACERPTGTAGAPQVWLYWYDPNLADYTFDMIDDGRTPKLVLDYFPHLGAHCAPTPDVQLIYLLPGTGMVRRESKDRYVAVHGSPLPYVPNIWLEGYFPTHVRRLSAIYSRRDRRTGQVELRRVDSLPFADSLLARPNFNPYRQFDLVWYRGQLFTGGSVATADFSLRATTLDDVDAIELQCSDSIPTGYQADTGYPWIKQLQESGGPVTAGNSTDFTVTVEHGNGGMKPFAFRIRTRKQFGSTTCYSPWSYYIPVPYGVSSGIPSVLVNCGHDALVANGINEIGHGSLPPHYCGSEAPVSFGGLGTTFVGGWFTGILWRQDWSVQERLRIEPSEIWPGFADPDLLFTGVILGAVFNSTQSGAGWPLSDPDQCPIQIPSVALGACPAVAGGGSGFYPTPPSSVPPGGGVPRDPNGNPTQPPQPPPVPRSPFPPLIPSGNPGGMDYGAGALILLANTFDVGYTTSTVVSRATWREIDPSLPPIQGLYGSPPAANPVVNSGNSPDAWDGNPSTGWSTIVNQTYGQFFGVMFDTPVMVGRVRLRNTGHAGEFPDLVQIDLLDENWKGFAGAALPLQGKVADGSDDVDVVFAENTRTIFILISALPAFGLGAGSMPARPWSVDELDVYTLDNVPYAPPSPAIDWLFVLPGAHVTAPVTAPSGEGLVPVYATAGVDTVGSRIYLSTPTEYAGLTLPAGAIGWITLVNSPWDSIPTPGLVNPRLKNVVPFYYQLSTGNAVPWPEPDVFPAPDPAPNWKLYTATAAQAALAPALPTDAYQWLVAATTDGDEVMIPVWPNTRRRLSATAGFPPVVDGV